MHSPLLLLFRDGLQIGRVAATDAVVVVDADHRLFHIPETIGSLRKVLVGTEGLNNQP